MVSLLREKIWWIVGLCGVVLLLVVVPSLGVKLATSSSRYDFSNTASRASLPARQTALVFGAGVMPDGTPTPYLKWRVQTAVDLYKIHKVRKIMMSGDNGSSHYNEPMAMGKLAETLGVPKGDIILDYAGFNTYDTCYRAVHVFRMTEATLVTQGYHLPRAVATCSGLSLHVSGVAAEHGGRDFTFNYILRESLSTNKALVQLAFKPKPTVLGNDY
jgi:vancomycin permeability regulator SanA